jgi:hypothetical protein
MRNLFMGVPMSKFASPFVLTGVSLSALLIVMAIAVTL